MLIRPLQTRLGPDCVWPVLHNAAGNTGSDIAVASDKTASIPHGACADKDSARPRHIPDESVADIQQNVLAAQPESPDQYPARHLNLAHHWADAAGSQESSGSRLRFVLLLKNLRITAGTMSHFALHCPAREGHKQHHETRAPARPAMAAVIACESDRNAADIPEYAARHDSAAAAHYRPPAAAHTAAASGSDSAKTAERSVANTTENQQVLIAWHALPCLCGLLISLKHQLTF